MDNYQEALVAASIYIFFVCAVSLPFIIAWVTNMYVKAIRRLNNLLDNFEENEKYYEKEEGKD